MGDLISWDAPDVMRHRDNPITRDVSEQQRTNRLLYTCVRSILKGGFALLGDTLVSHPARQLAKKYAALF